MNAYKCRACAHWWESSQCEACPNCSAEKDAQVLMKEGDPIKALVEERGKVYGDPYLSHTNIGLAWTGLLQQHYGITLSHPMPASLVAQMMVDFKMSRSCRVFHKDNYDDGHAYCGFAEDFQRREQGK